MLDQLAVLETSAKRLRATVENLDEHQLTASAYPAQWTVADVLSHLGSGAVITRRRLEDALAGNEMPAEYAPSVWGEWNAKDPAGQAAGALSADGELLERVHQLSEQERAAFQFVMGPIRVDIAGFLQLRLSEHALHSWDIEVTFDPTATIPAESAALVVDNLQLVAQYTGKASGTTETVHVRTTDPGRDLTVLLGPDAVSLVPAEPRGTPDLVLPAEALVRLVYGRLDPAHTPGSITGSAHLAALRAAFPGV